jgi:hypothetical protein
MFPTLTLAINDCARELSCALALPPSVGALPAVDDE